MSEQQRKLKTWQGWALFGGAMLIVFCLGLLAASLMERRAEVASIFNNRRFPMKDSIVSLNDSFATVSYFYYYLFESDWHFLPRLLPRWGLS